jgi:hypothetical protein
MPARVVVLGPFDMQSICNDVGGELSGGLLCGFSSLFFRRV